MSRIYDNWERLVAATLKKEQLWQLFHAPSISSGASDSSLSSSFSDLHLDSELENGTWTETGLIYVSTIGGEDGQPQQVHARMWSGLLKLITRVSKIFPEIEGARPPCSSGIDALCLLNNGIAQAVDIAKAQPLMPEQILYYFSFALSIVNASSF